MTDKKKQQLGMNPSTAQGRLLKDILWSFVDTSGSLCFQCGNKMSRDNFSIEHKIPWLDSEDPVGLFFDMENIGFSHLTCNVKAGRKQPAPQCGTVQRYKKYNCRCDACKAAKSAALCREYNADRRKQRYETTGR